LKLTILPITTDTLLRKREREREGRERESGREGYREREIFDILPFRERKREKERKRGRGEEGKGVREREIFDIYHLPITSKRESEREWVREREKSFCNFTILIREREREIKLKERAPEREGERDVVYHF